jgi:hypothetical protein
MSLFAEFEDLVSEKCDEIFGEPFEFRPMTQITVNDPVTPDTNRPITAMTAIYGSPTRILPELGAKTVTQGFASGHAEQAIMMRPRISIDVRSLVGGVHPRRLDQFRRDSTGDIYSVEDVEPDGYGRIVLYCAHLSKGPIP